MPLLHVSMYAHHLQGACSLYFYRCIYCHLNKARKSIRKLIFTTSQLTTCIQNSLCPPGPGGRLPSGRIEPSSETSKPGRGELWTLLETFYIVIVRCTETFWSLCIRRNCIFVISGRILLWMGHVWVKSCREKTLFCSITFFFLSKKIVPFI
jgi:hypothetical protein